MDPIVRVFFFFCSFFAPLASFFEVRTHLKGV